MRLHFTDNFTFPILLDPRYPLFLTRGFPVLKGRRYSVHYSSRCLYIHNCPLLDETRPCVVCRACCFPMASRRDSGLSSFPYSPLAVARGSHAGETGDCDCDCARWTVAHAQAQTHALAQYSNVLAQTRTH
jgi:hypothetical protein